MKQIVKKAAILIVLLLSVSFCLFAENTFNFQVSHAINVSAAYYFEFWKYRTFESIPNAAVSYSAAGDFGLATMGIAFTANVTISQLEIEVSNLVNVEDETKYLDFSFHVYKPNDTTVIDFAQESSHGAGSAVLFKNKSFVKYDLNHTWNTDEIADFRITLDDTLAEAGTYSGYLRFVVTT